MKIIVLIVLSLIVNIGWCQNNVPTKHQMASIFKSNDDYADWIICNQDSSFFKSDTLKLYNNINYFYQKSDCCKLIQWRFYKKNAFTRSDLQICKEPPTGSVLTENDYFKVKILSDKTGLYLFIINQKVSSGLFKVLAIKNTELADNNMSKIIFLKRLPSKHPINTSEY